MTEVSGIARAELTFVTEDDFDKQNKSIGFRMAGMSTLVGLLIAAMSIAGYESWKSHSAACEVESSMRVHEAMQVGEMKNIRLSLERIEEIGRENREDIKEQRKLMESWWRVNPLNVSSSTP